VNFGVDGVDGVVGSVVVVVDVDGVALILIVMMLESVFLLSPDFLSALNVVCVGALLETLAVAVVAGVGWFTDKGFNETVLRFVLDEEKLDVNFE
jgi:hypothetical protein